MHIKLMKVFECDSTGRNCQETAVRHPAVHEMRTAVRRLNKFEYPFVWFFDSEDVRDDAIPSFSVMGGSGDYVLSSFDGERRDRRMEFPSHGDELVDVWLSDQGCEIKERYVCHDLSFVLDVLANFAKTGKFPADAIWE
jgi:hypothetical protein